MHKAATTSTADELIAKSSTITINGVLGKADKFCKIFFSSPIANNHFVYRCLVQWCQFFALHYFIIVYNSCSNYTLNKEYPLCSSISLFFVSSGYL